jgi:hypothetical protein
MGFFSRRPPCRRRPWGSPGRKHSDGHARSSQRRTYGFEIVADIPAILLCKCRARLIYHHATGPPRFGVARDGSMPGRRSEFRAPNARARGPNPDRLREWYRAHLDEAQRSTGLGL